jgi:hypothetical protein
VLSPATDSTTIGVLSLQNTSGQNGSVAILARSVQQIIRFGRIRQSITLISGRKTYQYYNERFHIPVEFDLKTGRGHQSLIPKEHKGEIRLVAPETNIPTACQTSLLHLCVRVHTFGFSEHQDQ